MTGVALLGAGRIGKVHAASIKAAGAKLVAIYDVIGDAAEALALEHATTAVASVEEAMGNPEVAGVIIGTSTDTHVDLVQAAVDAGKAVLCEKPLAPSLAEAQACVTSLGDRARQVFLAFNRRFDPGHAAMKKAIDDGRIGKLEQLTIISRDPYPPPLDYIPRSGGLFRDMMIHDFDMARWVLGEEPVSLFAQGNSLVDSRIGALGDIDTAVVTMTTGSGKQAVILNSRRAVYGYDQRIEAFGSEGMVLSDNNHATAVRHFDTAAFGAPERFRAFFMERYADSYRLEIEAFVAGIRTGTPAPVSALDGLRAAYLAEAATVSRERGIRVELNADSEVTWDE